MCAAPSRPHCTSESDDHRKWRSRGRYQCLRGGKEEEELMSVLTRLGSFWQQNDVTLGGMGEDGRGSVSKIWKFSLYFHLWMI